MPMGRDGWIAFRDNLLKQVDEEVRFLASLEHATLHKRLPNGQMEDETPRLKAHSEDTIRSLRLLAGDVTREMIDPS